MILSVPMLQLYMLSWTRSQRNNEIKERKRNTPHYTLDVPATRGRKLDPRRTASCLTLGLENGIELRLCLRARVLEFGSAFLSLLRWSFRDALTFVALPEFVP